MDGMTSEEFKKTEAKENIVTAAQGLCALISEEQWNEMIDVARHNGIIDLKTSYRVMGKLIDLGMAVQEYGE